MSLHNRVTVAGFLIALGIIYGDIGTSPLYVLNAITSGKKITDNLVVGSLSLIIWTLTLQTTIKYVILTLNADNRGEGGIFSLFALVRRRKKWLVIPAMIGGAALLADGMITPPISVTSAIEGLKQLPVFSHDSAQAVNDSVTLAFKDLKPIAHAVSDSIVYAVKLAKEHHLAADDGSSSSLKQSTIVFIVIGILFVLF